MHGQLFLQPCGTCGFSDQLPVVTLHAFVRGARSSREVHDGDELGPARGCFGMSTCQNVSSEIHPGMIKVISDYGIK